MSNGSVIHCKILGPIYTLFIWQKEKTFSYSKMNSKCDTSPTAETMKNEDGAFEIIIQQIEGGTRSFIGIWFVAWYIQSLKFGLWMTFVRYKWYLSREFYKSEIERLLNEQTQIREDNERLTKNHNALQTEFQTQFCSRKLSD